MSRHEARERDRRVSHVAAARIFDSETHDANVALEFYWSQITSSRDTERASFSDLITEACRKPQ